MRQRMKDGVAMRTQNYEFHAANPVSSMGDSGGASMVFNYDSYNNRWGTVPCGTPAHPSAAVSGQGACNATTNRFVPATMSGDDYDAARHTIVMDGAVMVECEFR